MLVWLDTETTGLVHDREIILEVGMVITTDDLRAVGETSVVIHHPNIAAIRANCIPVVQQMHDRSGLWNEVAESTTTLPRGELELLEWLESRLARDVSPMCGSSILFDRQFIAHWMPNLNGYFHYRNIDVSSVKEWVRRKYGESSVFTNTNSEHRVLADLANSIAEMRFYDERFFVSAAPF